RILELCAVYEEAKDLINIGAYVSGNNPDIDTAIAHINAINSFLKQPIETKVALEDCLEQMRELFERSG
ncbi:MAG TPA: hypothetical protein PLM29_07595, partial [Deltaproteobacteria bacterium]|nr:hypothetical protein [Deltaproteobacteria bacterium]